MRVLVNALPLRGGGGATYVERQLSALSMVAPQLELHTLASPWSGLRGLPGRTEVVPVRSVPMRFAYEQWNLPRRRTDLLYCPANFGPLRTRAATVLTLHNANYYRAGLALQETKPSRPWWKVKANHAAMRSSDVVIAISQTLADEVTATVPGVEGKLHVILSGASEWPSGCCPVVGLPERYVVTVGSSAPHKHLDDVVTGWARSVEVRGDQVSLVVVGAVSSDQMKRHRELAGRHGALLVHLGHLQDRRHLKWVYELALGMVSMSVLEAFPLTPGEAGSVGCPMVLSDIPSHREVTLGNAHFVPPRDIDALADVLRAGIYSGRPGSRPWTWPVTWQMNARALADIMRLVA